MKKLITFMFVLICAFINAQSIFIDNQSYITLKSGGNVYVCDTSVSSIYSSGGGFYVPDTMGGFVEWNIQNNKGTYIVPFISYSSVYLPIYLNITNAGDGSSIKFSNVDTAVTSNTSYYNSSSINRYWTIDLSNFTTKPVATVTLTYDINDIPYNYNDLVLNYYNPSSVWVNSSTALYSIGSSTDTIGFASNRKWTLINSGTALPVSLSSFNAENIENKYSHLTWKTNSEVNNNGFEIQRSLNSSYFELVGWVNGHGNSSTLKSYSFDDFEVIKGNTYYYRLKQVDFDGNFVYSNVVSVKFDDYIKRVYYYNLAGQSIEDIDTQPSGVYIKLVNSIATLVGILK